MHQKSFLFFLLFFILLSSCYALDGTFEIYNESHSIFNISNTGLLQAIGNYIRFGDAGSLTYVDGDGDLYIEDELEVDGSAYIGSMMQQTVWNKTITAGAEEDLVRIDGSIEGTTNLANALDIGTTWKPKTTNSFGYISLISPNIDFVNSANDDTYWFAPLYVTDAQTGSEITKNRTTLNSIAIYGNNNLGLTDSGVNNTYNAYGLWFASTGTYVATGSGAEVNSYGIRTSNSITVVGADTHNAYALYIDSGTQNNVGFDGDTFYYNASGDKLTLSGVIEGTELYEGSNRVLTEANKSINFSTYSSVLTTGSIYIDDDIDDEHIEGDENTYLDVAGDTATGPIHVKNNLNVTGNIYIASDMKLILGNNSESYFLYNSTGGYWEIG